MKCALHLDRKGLFSPIKLKSWLTSGKSTTFDMNQEDIIIDGYTIVSRLGGGGFGEVFLGRANNTGREVAIKVEKVGLKEPQLRHEYKVYRELEKKSVECPRGFCHAEKYDHAGQYNYMIINLLGNSLSDLFRNRCSKRFSLKTVLQIADQMFERIEAFHDVHLIHRDISSGNFVVGREDPDTIYFIDFGMSTRFRDPHTLKHNPERCAASRRGTTRYASINNLMGRQQSRRDDLESIAYILIRFLRRELPWEHVSAAQHEKPHRIVREMKINTPIDKLCEGLPAVFGEFLKYARGLKFAADPDVPHWRAKFRQVYENYGYDQEPFSWDWTNLPARVKRDASVLTEPLIVAPVLVAHTDPIPRVGSSGRISPVRITPDSMRASPLPDVLDFGVPPPPQRGSKLPSPARMLPSPSKPLLSVQTALPPTPQMPSVLSMHNLSQRLSSDDIQTVVDSLTLHLPPSPVRRLSKIVLENQTRELTQGHLTEPDHCATCGGVKATTGVAKQGVEAGVGGMSGVGGVSGAKNVGTVGASGAVVCDVVSAVEVVDCTSARDDTSNTSNCDRYSPSLAQSREQIYTPLAASFESATTVNDGPYLPVTALPSPLHSAQNRSFGSFNSSLNNSAYSVTTATLPMAALSCACGVEEGRTEKVTSGVSEEEQGGVVGVREGEEMVRGEAEKGVEKGVEMGVEGVDSAKSDTTKVTTYPANTMLR